MFSPARAAFVALATVPTVAFIIVPAASSLAEAPAPPAAATPALTPLPTVVSVERVHPLRMLRLRDRFKVPAFPSSPYVLNVIAPYEAARWGVSYPRLRCRISGESGGSVNATNGQYAGVGQFAAETFNRGVHSIGLRGVRLVKERWRAKTVMVREHLSDGTVQVRKGWKVRQRIIHVFHGMIPRNPPVRHAWAQVRIMARAMAGLGAVNDSEWEVRC